MKIKLNSIVTWKTPASDEADYPTAYKVIEDRDDRVLIEPLYFAYSIAPTTTALKKDLRASFKEHSDVIVPDWVDFDVWEDSSWHNDATASIVKGLEGGYEVRVWIYDLEAWENSGCDYEFKYSICLYHPEGYGSEGDQTSDDNEIIALMNDYLSNYKTKIEQAKWL